MRKKVSEWVTVLLEYRTRLISDVVSGKLEVHEAAAKLPDESDDFEPMDDSNTIPEEEQT